MVAVFEDILQEQLNEDTIEQTFYLEGIVPQNNERLYVEWAIKTELGVI